jgi:hypothetical protein
MGNHKLVVRIKGKKSEEETTQRTEQIGLHKAVPIDFPDTMR